MSSDSAGADSPINNEPYPDWILATVAWVNRENELTQQAAARRARDPDPEPGGLLDHMGLLDKLSKQFSKNNCGYYYATWLDGGPPPRDPPPDVEFAALHAVREALTHPIAYYSYLTPDEGKELQGLRARVRRAVRDRGRQLERVADPFGELRTFAANTLKGNQRKVVETICDANGSCPLADLAIALGWNREEAVPRFNEYKKAIQPKLRSADLAWRLSRERNHARANRISEK
jgi:hypothetical protein